MSKTELQRPAKIIIGEIVKAHGVRGAVVLRIAASMRDAVAPGTTLELASATGPVSAEVTACNQHPSGLRLRLRGVDDRDRALALVGSQASVPRDKLPDLAPGEYYDSDVIGCEVRDTGGEVLGRVSEVIATGSNDVYVVPTGCGEILVPAIAKVVIELDTAARSIVVDSVGLVYNETSGRKT